MAVVQYNDAAKYNVANVVWTTASRYPGKPICVCLRYHGGAYTGLLKAHAACPNCKGFGFPPVPFEDVE